MSGDQGRMTHVKWNENVEGANAMLNSLCASPFYKVTNCILLRRFVFICTSAKYISGDREMTLR